MLATTGTRTPHFPGIPVPRRLPVALAVIASVGVFATSLRALPAAVLFPLAVVWFAAFAAGAFALRSGRVILTVLAALVKIVTIALAVWAVTHPHSAIGPHTALDWVPLGMLNSGTGLWLLALIRHRAQ